MTDAYLSTNDKMEALSRAYVGALAARAGYDVTKPEFDRDSIDAIISARGEMRPQIHAQLKATSTVMDQEGEEFSFRISGKNYSDLSARTQSPRVLVVLTMPGDEVDWFSHSTEHLLLRRCAYWKSLFGLPTIEQDSITIKIPKSQVLDVPTLQSLMQKSRMGTPL